jgi:hypothetical protein
MKKLAFLLSIFLVNTLAHAATSQYAGRYYALAESNGSDGQQLVAGFNIDVADDGSLTGSGVYTDFTPLTVTGKVKPTGKVVLYTVAEGHQTRYTTDFNPNGKQFTVAITTQTTITAKKVVASFPEAGIYHSKTNLGKEAVFFVAKTGTVRGIFNSSDSGIVNLTGKTTNGNEQFNASSDAGITFYGKFNGAKIKGTFINVEASYGGGTFSGARY